MQSRVFPHHGHRAAKGVLTRCPLIQLEVLFQEPYHYRVENSGNWVDTVIQESCCALPFFLLKMSLERAVSCSGSAPAGWAQQPPKGRAPLPSWCPGSGSRQWEGLCRAGRSLLCPAVPLFLFGTTSLMK